MNIKIRICALNICKIVGISTHIFSTFVTFLEVSVGAVREISRFAYGSCQCSFAMQWIYVIYGTNKDMLF